MYKIFASFLLSVFMALPAYSLSTSLVWDAGDFETTPSITDAFSEGPTRFHDLKLNIRLRSQVEHHFGTATGGFDNGLHRLGAARVFLQNTEPTDLLQADYSNGSGGPSAGTLLAGDEAEDTNTPAQLRGHGRLYVDRDGADNDILLTDDNRKLYIYDQDTNDDGTYDDPAFLEVTAQHDDTTELSKQKSLAKNILGCGGFECNQLTDVTVPQGGNWVKFGTSALSYAATLATEGGGLELQTSSTIDGNGVIYTLAGLKLQTTYFVVARVRKISGVDSCGISTLNMSTGGGTDMAGVNTDLATYTTLSGTFITGTSLHVAPQLKLEANISSGAVVCAFDTVSVSEQVPDNNLPTPGASFVHLAYTDNTEITDTGAAYADLDNPIMDVSVVVPGNGYYIEVTANLCMAITDGPDLVPIVIYSRLSESVDGGGFSKVSRIADNFMIRSSAISYASTLVFNYRHLNPIPGSTYRYNIGVGVEKRNLSSPAVIAFTNPTAAQLTEFSDFHCAHGTESFIDVAVKPYN